MVLREIKPKGGREYRDIYTDISGRECKILQMHMLGRDGLMINVPFDRNGNERRIFTSEIQKYYDNGEYVTVETSNTIYMFRK